MTDNFYANVTLGQIRDQLSEAMVGYLAPLLGVSGNSAQLDFVASMFAGYALEGAQIEHTTEMVGEVEKHKFIRHAATHTIFPLSQDKIIIFTNLSWVRNPYQTELSYRPNPTLFRSAMFNFMQIQTHRMLLESEVQEINYIIKKRALRYIAAAEKDWLYPENFISSEHWRKFGKGYLLMPDPRPLFMGGEIIVGYKDGHSDAFSEYGHKPWQKGYKDEKREKVEGESLYAFQGEFAHLFGSKRRGRSYEFGRLEGEEDSSEFHEYHLEQYRKFKNKKTKLQRRRITLPK